MLSIVSDPLAVAAEVHGIQCQLSQDPLAAVQGTYGIRTAAVCRCTQACFELPTKLPIAVVRLHWKGEGSRKHRIPLHFHHNVCRGQLEPDVLLLYIS